MQLEDLVLVSVDDHVVEPPTVFEGRLPAKYADLAPTVDHPAGRDQCLGLRRDRNLQYRAQRRGRQAAGGVRNGADVLRSDPSRHLEHPRSDQGHGRQWGTRLPVLSVLYRLLRTAVRPDRRQRRGPGHGAGLQRLAHRRMVRDLPRALHRLSDPRHLGRRGHGGRGAEVCGQGGALGHLLGEPQQAGMAEPPLRLLGPVLDGMLR